MDKKKVLASSSGGKETAADEPMEIKTSKSKTEKKQVEEVFLPLKNYDDLKVLNHEKWDPLKDSP